MSERPQFADLLDDVEALPGMDGWQRAEALTSLADDCDLRDLLTQASYRLLEVRYRRGFGEWAPTGVGKGAMQEGSQPMPVARDGERWAAGARPNEGGVVVPVPQPRQRSYRGPSRRRHASPKQLAAGMAWRDLLCAQMALPGVGKIQVQDMSADQLVTAADALFDISEQLHDLARAVTAAGVDNARSLPDDTLTAIGGATEQAS